MASMEPLGQPAQQDRKEHKDLKAYKGFREQLAQLDHKDLKVYKGYRDSRALME
jgi:hypothetical protein